MPNQSIDIETTAQALVHLLAARGVEHFFGNAGTDFASLIDAFARAEIQGRPAPTPITVPHEVPAVAMAYGAYMVSGRPQAVMVHVTVGTANALSGIINAARDNVPILFMAGRTPLTEGSARGARDRYIHWAQESFDQGAMVREYVKWDYELRRFDQLEDVIDRALEVAVSEPRGPVYLTLPREVLAEPHQDFTFHEPSRRAATVQLVPEKESLREVASLLGRAHNPMVITGLAGRSPAAVPALVTLAERFAVPVIDFNRRAMSFPTDHPMHLGFEVEPFIAEADLVLAVESDVPWYPSISGPPDSARVVHIGVDPIFSRYPIRSYPASLALPGDAGRVLNLVLDAGTDLAELDGESIAARRERLAALHGRQRAQWRAAAEQCGDDAPVDPRYLSRCLSEAKPDNAIVVNEYDLVPEQVEFTQPGTFYGSSAASGLGWGLGASLGAKLAAPDRLVIATVGDGAYQFGNPTPCHFVSRAQGLPVLTVVFNNGVWGAVQRASDGLHGNGWARKANRIPLSVLEPSPDYELLCIANGGYGEKVERGLDVVPALERALHAVQVEKRQALLNVVCKKPGAA